MLGGSLGNLQGGTLPLSAPVRNIEDLSPKFATYICKAAVFEKPKVQYISPVNDPCDDRIRSNKTNADMPSLVR